MALAATGVQAVGAKAAAAPAAAAEREVDQGALGLRTVEEDLAAQSEARAAVCMPPVPKVESSLRRGIMQAQHKACGCNAGGRRRREARQSSEAYLHEGLVSEARPAGAAVERDLYAEPRASQRVVHDWGRSHGLTSDPGVVDGNAVDHLAIDAALHVGRRDETAAMHHHLRRLLARARRVADVDDLRRHAVAGTVRPAAM